MFNSLHGEITLKAEERLCLLTGGVEWELVVSRRAAERLPPVGQTARVFTHLLHREDSMRLYGFSDQAERALFLDLQKVDGVGPRGAMKILSGIDREKLAQALDRDDVEELSAVPGIGRKTAQKIILTLKGKLTPAEGTAGKSAEEDITAALVGMGFDRKKAKAAVASAVKAIAAAGAGAPHGEEFERELFRRAVAIAGGEESRK
jgi:Holliday junction DNA helicase RuvA